MKAFDPGGAGSDLPVCQLQDSPGRQMGHGRRSPHARFPR
jgi:hypothetical protein